MPQRAASYKNEFDGRFHWARVDDPEAPLGLPDHVPAMYGSIVPESLKYQRIPYFLVAPRYVGVSNVGAPSIVEINSSGNKERDKLLGFYRIQTFKINPYLIPEKTLIGYLKPYDKKDDLFYDGAPVIEKNKELVDAFHKIKSDFMTSWINFEVTRMAKTGFSLPVAISQLMLTDVYSNYYNILANVAVSEIGVDDGMTGFYTDRGSLESRDVFRKYESHNLPRKYTAEWNFGYLEAMAEFWYQVKRDQTVRVKRNRTTYHAGSGMEWG
jgi:hypothetical protein